MTRYCTGINVDLLVQRARVRIFSDAIRRAPTCSELFSTCLVRLWRPSEKSVAVVSYLYELRQRIATEQLVWWQLIEVLIATEQLVWWQLIEVLACQSCQDGGMDVAYLVDEEQCQQGTERRFSVSRQSPLVNGVTISWLLVHNKSLTAVHTRRVSLPALIKRWQRKRFLDTLISSLERRQIAW